MKRLRAESTADNQRAPNDRTQKLDYLLDNLTKGPSAASNWNAGNRWRKRIGSVATVSTLRRGSRVRATSPSIPGSPVTDFLNAVKTNVTAPDVQEEIAKFNDRWFENAKSLP